MKKQEAKLLPISVATSLLIFNKPTVTFSSPWLENQGLSTWYLTTLSPESEQNTSYSFLDTASLDLPVGTRADIAQNPVLTLGPIIQQTHRVDQQRYFATLRGDIGISATTTLSLSLSAEDVKELHHFAYDTNLGSIAVALENDYVQLKPSVFIQSQLSKNAISVASYQLGWSIPPLRIQYADHSFSWLPEESKLNAGIAWGQSFKVGKRFGFYQLDTQLHQPLIPELGGISIEATWGEPVKKHWMWQAQTAIKWHMPHWTHHDFSSHGVTAAASQLAYYGIPFAPDHSEHFSPYDEISLSLSVVKSTTKHPNRHKLSGVMVGFDPHTGNFKTGVMTSIWFQF
ncbi:MAG: hypothetical protein IPP74_11210 [Alphaproteobacteria bacterium]|nr:hypothetical protein [Alphaproteobacteria bacterium]